MLLQCLQFFERDTLYVRPSKKGHVTMTNQEAISLASVIVATISVSANIVMGITIYRRNRRNIARDDLVSVLRLLLQKLEHTRLFEVDPNYEIWEYGFVTLSELAAECASAHVAVQHARSADDALREAVSGLHDHVKSLRALQDSWQTFRHGKEGSWVDIQRSWPDIERAKAGLDAARPMAQQCKRAVSKFLGAG